MRLAAAPVLALSTGFLLGLPARAQTTGSIAGRAVDAVSEASVADAVVITTRRVYELKARALPDADHVAFGLVLAGAGKAWIDEVSIEAVE